MAMGIISNEEFLKELERHRRNPAPKNEEPTAEIIEKKDRGWNGGRNSGDTEVPESIRKTIAGCALEGIPARHTAEVFGVSESSVAAYKKGTTSLANYYRPDKDLEEYIKSRKSEISGRARETLFDALNKITPDKLEATKARDLAGIAKDMSAIIKDMDGDSDRDSQTNIIFYSPKAKSEEDYVTVEVVE